MVDDWVRRGGMWVAAQLLLMAVVFAGAPMWGAHWQSWTTQVIGAVLAAIGGGCGILGTVALGRRLSPFPEPASGRLVTTGIYGLIRHPLYTAVFCGSLGWALLFSSWPATIAACALAPFLDAKARGEERRLRARFPEYFEYQKRTKRFVPGVY